jgi:iron complex transport system permease protein
MPTAESRLRSAVNPTLISMQRHALTRARLAGYLLAATAALILAVVAGLAWGSTTRNIWDLFGDDSVLLYARLPRVIFAAVVGAALAISGAVFQAVLRNPLADPFILGVSGGAALGGSLMLAVPAASFAGALASLALILTVSRWLPGGRLSTYVLLLTGVVFNAFASAVIMFLKAILSAQKAQELLFYLMGTLSVEGTPILETLALSGTILLCCVVLVAFARELNLLSLGEDEARALGVNVENTRRWVVIVASLGVAVSVAYTGLIGFVGLVVPHGVRLIVGPDHRLLLPMCALVGGSFLVTCDLIARLAFSVLGTSLPVGVVTACIGAPLFIYFLRRNLLRQEGE